MVWFRLRLRGRLGLTKVVFEVVGMVREEDQETRMAHLRGLAVLVKDAFVSRHLRYFLKPEALLPMILAVLGKWRKYVLSLCCSL